VADIRVPQPRGAEGKPPPVRPPLHALRPHRGQVDSAANLRALLEGSEIAPSHEACGRVQDAYSLRCMPQVHGSARDGMRFTRSILEVEIDAVTDNPIVFPEEGDVLSGGNFHGESPALALDCLAIAVAALASISERRRPDDEPGAQRPAAVPDARPGLNSGLMMAHVTAAALVSENKVLCHPASVDSIPTEANQEDHVSMGPIAARKARSVVEHARRVLAIEILRPARRSTSSRPCGRGGARARRTRPCAARCRSWSATGCWPKTSAGRSADPGRLPARRRRGAGGRLR